MGNALIILILLVIGVFAVKNYAKNLAHGCCGSGGDTVKKVRVRDRDPAHYPHCVRIAVEGMTCSHCQQRVENALNAEEGVWAQADWKAGSALVRMKTPVSEDILRKIITRAGYTVKAVQAEPLETA